jgi:hypothetical protein
MFDYAINKALFEAVFQLWNWKFWFIIEHIPLVM